MVDQIGLRKQQTSLLQKMPQQRLPNLYLMTQQLRGDISLLHHLDHSQEVIQLCQLAQL